MLFILLTLIWPHQYLTLKKHYWFVSLRCVSSAAHSWFSQIITCATLEFDMPVLYIYRCYFSVFNIVPSDQLCSSFFLHSIESLKKLHNKCK